MQSKPVYAAVNSATNALLSTQFDYEKQRYFVYCPDCKGTLHFPDFDEEFDD
jgi:aminopeptidase N